MRKKSMKILFLLLTLALLIGVLPGMTAFAEDTYTIRLDGTIINRTAALNLSYSYTILLPSGYEAGLSTRYSISPDSIISGSGILLYEGMSSGCDLGRLSYKPMAAGSATITISFNYGANSMQLPMSCERNYAVTLSSAANSTRSGGLVAQNVTPGEAMSDVTFTAKSGYQFPAASSSYTTTNGITVARTSDTVVTISGTPTDDSFIAVPDAVKLSTVTYVANNGTGETKEYKLASGETHTVQGQLFPAPDGMEFAGWLGDDGRAYLPGAPITETRTLTAQWEIPQRNSTPEKVPEDDGWEYHGDGNTTDRAYRSSFAPMQGGKAQLVLNNGETAELMNIYPGTTVWVNAIPDPGYRVASIVWSFIDGSASFDITETKCFVMPAMEVVIFVTFQPIA